MKKGLILILSLVATSAFAQSDIEKDFDSLGGNTILLEKAKALNPEVATSVVQNRTVVRDNRFEVSPEVAGTFGGDTYTRSTTVGLNVQYHFNHRWSAGVKANTAFNRLTDEGRALVDRAEEDFKNNPQDSNAPVPDLDYLKSEIGGFVNFYPIYGKMAWFDRSVAHFDVYAQVGAGQVELKSGNTSTYSAGLGVGIWVNPKVSTRLEMKYQNYTGQYYTGAQSLDLAVASMQVGWLL
ncbi:MAG: outer membrane beta-barrel domain-containing protein [Bdellovibrionia bacterium]